MAFGGSDAGWILLWQHDAFSMVGLLTLNFHIQMWFMRASSLLVKLSTLQSALFFVVVKLRVEIFIPPFRWVGGCLGTQSTASWPSTTNGKEYRISHFQNLKLSKLQNDCSSSKQNKKVNDRAKMIVRVAFINNSEMIVKNDCQNDRDSKFFEK